MSQEAPAPVPSEPVEDMVLYDMVSRTARASPQPAAPPQRHRSRVADLSRR